MGKYVLQRCFWLIVTVVVTAFFIFTLLYVVPGDPGTMILGGLGSADDIKALNDQLGVNDPYLVQLGRYMYKTFIKFDFDTSWTYQVPVMDQLMERLPRTLILNLMSMVVITVMGVWLGVICGTKANTVTDNTIMVVSMVFHCAPAFWVALMMIVLFSAKLNWLPAYGFDNWKCFIMPVFSGALGGIAGNARQARSSILEVCRADYITTARAKGQVESKVITKHMLPNAMMPIITQIGGGLAKLIGGNVITEQIFAIPGVGLYLLSATNQRDYPVVRGCIVFFSLFSSVMMLLTDLAYAFINPQIKARYAGGRK